MKRLRTARPKKFLGGVLLAVMLLLGAFSVFLFTGKEKALQTQLEGVHLQSVEDGRYTGSYRDFRWSNTVDVTVSDHRITDITVTKSQVFAARESIQELTSRVLSEQTTEVDVISGATADSKAFLKAVENALHKTGE